MRGSILCGRRTVQLPLLAELPAPRPPIARNSDPETSHLAAAEITESGKRDEQAVKVLGLLRTHPGLTSFELADHYRVDRYMVARRLPELRGDGLANNGPDPEKPLKRRCKVTGRLAMLWFPGAAA